MEQDKSAQEIEVLPSFQKAPMRQATPEVIQNLGKSQG